MVWLKSNKLEKCRICLLIISHPDDEAMFFSPLLITLIKSSRLYLLCLSNGDFEGFGNLRIEELYQSASILQIQKSDVTIIQHPHIRDGLTEVWSIDILSDLILNHLKMINPDLVITFDEYGVSSHPNHIATNKGVIHAISRYNLNIYSKIKCIKLETTNCIRKFLGPFDIILSLILWNDIIVINWNILTTFRSMQSHSSQFVWYRRLFIIFSRYTYINTFSFVEV